MMDNVFFNEKAVKEQYRTAENLNARMELHKYNTNKTDWSEWCFKQMSFKENARILEIGCGNGELWSKNRDNIDESWNITLSDLSKGMLQSAENKLKSAGYNLKYEEADAQNIPHDDESFDVAIARHMLYHVPDIEKALSEINRVLVKGGRFYATTNAHDTMEELHELIEGFDTDLGLDIRGMGSRFNMRNGQVLIERFFNDIECEVFKGRIVVPYAEPVVAYVASTMRGGSILVGDKREEFKNYIEGILKEKGSITITTKACMFKARK